MSYEVRITRAEHWSESEKAPITLAEWMAYVAQDPEMRLDGFAECEVEGSTLRVESDGLAVWTRYSGNGVGGNMAWFDHHKGQVVVASPDHEILEKMRQIARYFKARVMGDEGELY
jgi:hypothetical protein